MKSRLLFALVVPAFCGFLAPPRATACINDRDSDTLAQQGKQLPEVLRVITGRFERNPPLYYQMRAARIEGELRAHPERLPLYDDIAVALDRLGKDDLAISWMNRKYARLQSLDAKAKPDASTREARYRYYANNGTFWAHRWLRADAKRAKIGEMKTARNFIARAIKIKPDAHYGREKYQLLAMDWIIDPRVKDYQGKMEAASLAEYISGKSDTSDKGITGLSGLVVLGNAWESLDIFDALRNKLTYEKSTLQYLTVLRERELIARGKKSLLPGSGSGAQLEKELGVDELTLNPPSDPHWGISVNLQNQATLQKAYRDLRAEAESWQSQRTSYMMARLQNGQHPDTDKNFWREWRETSAPSLELPWHSDRAAKREALDGKKSRGTKLLWIGALFSVTSFALLSVRRRRLA